MSVIVITPSSSQRSRLPSSKPQPVEKTFQAFSPPSIDISPHLNQPTLHYYDQDVVRELSIPPESSSSTASIPRRRYPPPPPPVNGPHHHLYPPTESSRFPFPNLQHVPPVASQPPSLRTPPVNLLSQHGLPLSLPPPPRTTFVAEQAQIQSTNNNTTTASIDPSSSDLAKILDSLLSGSYMNMLANKTDTTISADASSASVVENTVGDFSVDDLFRQDMFDDNDFLTSPQLDPPYQQHHQHQQQPSPDETPFINTPLDGTFNSPILFDPEDDSFGRYYTFDESDGDAGMPPSFGSAFPPLSSAAKDESSQVPPQVVESYSFLPSPYTAIADAQEASKVEPITPALPPLDQAQYVIQETPSMSPALLFTPATPSMSLPQFTQHATSSSSSRPTRPLPTGIRRGITPSSLVPIDAPTQARHYATPSATSRKAVPAAFLSKGKKRDRSESMMPDDDSDRLEDPATAVDGGAVDENTKDAIEAKRRQNTLAARRSRARKLEYTRELEEKLECAYKERDAWMGRAEVAEQKLMAAGLL